MPEKQICKKCGHEKKKHEDYAANGIIKTYCKTLGCICTKFEPQVLCKWCGKPKGEHKQKYSIVPEFNGLFCDDGSLEKFEPTKIELKIRKEKKTCDWNIWKSETDAAACFLRNDCRGCGSYEPSKKSPSPTNATEETAIAEFKKNILKSTGLPDWCSLSWYNQVEQAARKLSITSWNDALSKAKELWFSDYKLFDETIEKKKKHLSKTK